MSASLRTPVCGALVAAVAAAIVGAMAARAEQPAVSPAPNWEHIE